MVNGWKYYNHAVVPTGAPHEDVDLSPIMDGSIWSVSSKALLVKWTSNFDCAEQTNWWYIVKDSPFDIMNLKAKRRYEINKGIKNFNVIRIDAEDYKNELYDITIEAYSSWPSKYRPSVEKNSFILNLNKWKDYIVYGAFDSETNKICGYAYLKKYETCYYFTSLRVVPQFEKKGINAAIVAKILKDFSDNYKPGEYICDGSRSINHETAFQDYLEKYFDFRKAYCCLEVRYRYPFLIKIFFPFRKILQKLDKFSFVHKINGILKIEEIIRQ